MSDDTVDIAEKAKFFSKQWWKNMFSAMKIWKYSPKEHAIFQLSSFLSYGNVFVGTLLWNWVKAKWAIMLLPFFKAVVKFATAVFVGLKMMVVG